MSNRIVWIDYAKAIGIYLVILAHTQTAPFVVDWISVFRMPLFFFLSGYLFSYDRNPVGMTFVKKRFRQLVIPYLCLNIITYLFWFFISRHYGTDASLQVMWYEPVKGMLLADGFDMIHNRPLWFLVCLFILEVTYYYVFLPIKDNSVRFLIILVFGLLGYVNAKYIPFRLPFSIGTALIGIVFYFIGHEVRRVDFSKVSTLWKTLVGFVCLAVVCWAAVYNDRVYLYINQYGNFLIFLLAAVAGIYMMRLLCEALASVFGEQRAVGWVARNTLAICGFHLMMFTLVKGFTTFVLRIPVSMYAGSIAVNVLLAAAGIVLCVPMVWFFNRFFPVVLGGRRKKI